MERHALGANQVSIDRGRTVGERPIPPQQEAGGERLDADARRTSDGAGEGRLHRLPSGLAGRSAGGGNPGRGRPALGTGIGSEAQTLMFDPDNTWITHT